MGFETLREKLDPLHDEQKRIEDPAIAEEMAEKIEEEEVPQFEYSLLLHEATTLKYEARDAQQRADRAAEKAEKYRITYGLKQRENNL